MGRAERGLAHPPSAAYEEAFERHPDARGALVTSPTLRTGRAPT
ncbi:hypothetical protein [Streptomyces sp. KL116D]